MKMNLLLRLREHLPKEIASEAFFRIHPPTENDLFDACRNGKSLLIEQWISHGLVDISGIPIVIATTKGYSEIVALFLRCGVDPSFMDNMALYWAAERGYYKIVSLLLEHGASASEPCNAPIYWAATNGHSEIVLCLCN